MKWVVLIILWGNLAWGSVVTLTANSLWTNCLLQVSRHDPATLMPSLYLQPGEERALIGVLMKTKTKKWVLGLSDYIGSHENIFRLADLEKNGLTDVVFGGEILIRNSTTEAGFGEIIEVGDASGFLFETIQALTVAQRDKLNGVAFKNSPTFFLTIMNMLMPSWLAEQPKIVPYAERTHLLPFSPDGMRHTFLSYVFKLDEMVKKREPLGDTIENLMKESITIEELIKKIKWVTPHLKSQLSLPVSGYESLPVLLEAWQRQEMGEADWAIIKTQLSKLSEDISVVSDRILLIELN